MLSQGPGIHPLDSGNFPPLKVIIEGPGGAPIAGYRRQFSYDKPTHVRLAALVVELVCSVITDQRIGHRDDLTAVGRIRKEFLITGHRGVKTDLADCGAGCAERFSAEGPPVF